MARATMYLVAIAWIYVVLMMALAEALSPQGSVLGAFFTLLLYGALPVTVVLYIMGTPMRRRARLAAERAELAAMAPPADPADPAHPADPTGPTDRPGPDRPLDRAGPPEPPAVDRDGAAASAGAPPHGGGQPPGDPVAPVRKEA